MMQVEWNFSSGKVRSATEMPVFIGMTRNGEKQGTAQMLVFIRFTNSLQKN
jgi:hypothetical protein